MMTTLVRQFRADVSDHKAVMIVRVALRVKVGSEFLWSLWPGTGEGKLSEKLAPPEQSTKGSNPMNARRSHFLPRTRSGWIATIAFILAMALAQPPVVHGLANRIEPWILGMPFLFAYLLGVYCLMIAVLIWTLRKGI